VSAAWPSAVAAGWHPVAHVTDLGARPLARRLMDVPLVVFAGPSGPVVLRDRCPHRAMPLSLGRVTEGAIECPYHGWRFGEGGRCVAVPGTDAVPDIAAVPLPVEVRAGLVWTSLAAPAPPPFPRLPGEMEDEVLDYFYWKLPATRARLLDAIENHLDATHPHFLHPWMVRSPKRRRPVHVAVRTGPEGGEAVYTEEARAIGWLPRMLEGHRARSIGRYFPPTIGQILFENSSGLAVSITVVFAPEADGLVRPYAHFASQRRRAPAWLKRWLLKGFHTSVLRQDQRALRRQAEAIAEAGEQPYAIGPLDLLGPAIWQLAHGRTPAPEERALTMYL
jgi:phenylpropionate dioxygenase-like ring-hydroxylating dioxygenase large terminal subunit